MKKVSVIIPCFNQGKYLNEAIESVLSQTYKNIEIVLVNDASLDNTKELAQEYLKKLDNFIFVDNKQNSGLSFTRNTGIEKASGEYILPLDADDTIEPTYIEKAVKILDSNRSIGMVYCKAKYFGAKSGEWILSEFNFENFLCGNCIFCSALYRKEDWAKAGKYDTSMKTAWEDWDLWLSFLELGLKPYRIQEILFNYRKHSYQSMIDKKFDSLPIYKHLIKKHKDLYLNQDEIVKEIFENNTKRYIRKIKKLKIIIYFCLLMIITLFAYNIQILLH